MSSELVAPPPAFGITHESGLIFADLRVPEPPELEEALLPPEEVRPPRRVLRVVACRGSSWPVAARKFVRQCSQ